MKVCVHCFNDLELKRFIISNSVEKGKCDSCSNSIVSELLNVEELLDFFAEFIEIFENDESGTPLINIIQNDWNIFSEEKVCQNILSDLLVSLNSSLFNANTKVCYVYDIEKSTLYWEMLKEDLKWKRRFLTDINGMIELGWDSFFGKQNTLSPSRPLYRARLHFNGEKKPFSNKDMGSPPKRKSSSGRANPQGIPFLYLSTDINTTLYETRAIYLDDVSIGEFRIKDNSKIIVVDFTEEESPFLHMGNLPEYAKSKLLKKYISLDLSKPIRRFDSELEYIPTQFICEFIRYITGADGILFDSSLHKGGKNIVLFEQDKVECISVAMHQVIKVEIEAKNISFKKKH
ncbi:MAG: hypothetical protein A2046_11115 [Bacteroidetes bacterium GWA2_30_7]|nr:MAG: hypothetical protein A2046_11115 [Bacteroidetes bacterium GWA2_30_7]